MKNIARIIFVNFFALCLISVVLTIFDYANSLKILFYAAIALSLINWLVRPVLNIIFLPLNLITLGTFRWIVNIIVLILISLIVVEFQIKAFTFPGLTFQGFVIPVIKFSSFWTYLLAAFLLNVVSDIIYTVFE